MSYDIYLKDPVTHETISLPFNHTMTGGTYAADYNPNTDTWTPKPISEAHLNITYNYGRYYGEYNSEGICCIYGKTGLESIVILEKMIDFIKSKYHDGKDWITTDGVDVKFYDANGKELDFYDYLHSNENERVRKEIPVKIYEGDTSNYWQRTAANALRPLYQLLTMAKTRPDGVWDGD